MRTLNVRLLAMLLLICGLVAGAAFAVHAYQVRRNAAVLLRKAATAKEQRDLLLAIDYLERYLALVPKGNADSLAELGLLLADAQRTGDAYRTLEAALREDPKRSDVRRKLVDCAMRLGRFPDARHHLTELFREFPHDIDLMIQMGRCQIGLNEPVEAVRQYQMAIENAPENVEYYGEFAAVTHGRLKDPLGALQILDELVTRNPENARAYLIRGAHRLDHAGEIERARAMKTPGDEKPAGDDSDSIAPLKLALDDARTALQLASEDEAAVVFNVRCLIANDAAEEARDLAEQALDRFPKNPYLYGSLAELDRKAGKLSEAVAWFERGLKALPQQTDLLWNLADSLIDLNRPDEAREYVDRLRKSLYPRPPIRYLDAKMQMAREDWFEASRQFEAVRPLLMEWPALARQTDFLLGQCYQRLGRNDLQLERYIRAVREDPQWIPARLGVANALFSSGKLEEAYEEYRAIAAFHFVPNIVLEQLARLTTLLNLSRNESQRDWAFPSALVDRLEENDPKSVSVPLLRAEMLVAQGKPDEAEQLMLAARDKSPDAIDLWLGLVSLAELQGDDEKADRILAEARAATGDTVAMRLAQARRLVDRLRAYSGDDVKAEREKVLRELRRLTEDVSSLSEAESGNIADLYGGVASAALAVGDFDETERLCTLVADMQKSNLRIRLLLFDLAFRSRKLQAMEKILAELHEIERSGPLWHYGTAVKFAVMAADEKRPELYEQAKLHLFEARIARPNWSRAPVLLGRIHDAQKDEDAALASFLDGIRLGERSPEILNRAVGLLYQRRRFSDVDRLIRDLQEQKGPFSSQLVKLAADVSLRLNDRERALSLVTKSAEKSRDAEELIWAGRILFQLGKREEAENSFRRAVEVDEASPAAWAALVQYYGLTVQLEKADAALSEAAVKIPPDKAPLAMARSLEFIGRFEEAEAQYQRALEADPDNVPLMKAVAEFWFSRNKPQEAQTLVERVLKADGATENDRLWARRSLAVVAISRPQPSPAEMQRALELVTENLKRNPDSQEDRRAKALILANMPDAERTKEAAQILEEVLQKEQSEGTLNPSHEARFILAKLYVAMKQDALAIRHLRTLLVEKENDRRYLAYYVSYLISRNEIADAELYLNQLISVAGHDDQTLALASEIRFARGQYDALLNAVVANGTKPVGSAVQQQKRRHDAAFLLESFGHRLKRSLPPDDAKETWAGKFLQAANDLLQQFEQQEPRQSLVLAAFYARNGRFDESLDALEQRLDSCRPEEVAAVSAEFLTSGLATDDQMSRLEGVLRKSLETHERNLILILALADHLNWSAKYRDAEQLYREALRLQPENLSALNNLAVLLALSGKNSAEASNLIEKAITLRGTLSVLLDSRGTVRMVTGDATRAADDLRQAVAMRPSSGSYFRLALAELQLGKDDAARKALLNATNLGLTESTLHPLERPLLRQLQSKLK
jgi:tetratricopeptide (TPR) repeat protein